MFFEILYQICFFKKGYFIFDDKDVLFLNHKQNVTSKFK
jgi:hypothetical protein